MVTLSLAPVPNHTHPSSEYRQKLELWILNGRLAMAGMEDYSIVSARVLLSSFL